MSKLVIALAIACLSGCSLFGSVDDDFKAAARVYHDEVMRHYPAYIDADSALDANGKRIRKQPVEEFGALLQTVEKED